MLVLPQVPGSEEEVHLRAEGAEAEGAEPLHHPVHHQPHHGPQVLPHQNVPGGGLWVLLPVHAGGLITRLASTSFIGVFFFPLVSPCLEQNCLLLRIYWSDIRVRFLLYWQHFSFQFLISKQHTEHKFDIALSALWQIMQTFISVCPTPPPLPPSPPPFFSVFRSVHSTSWKWRIKTLSTH